MKLVQLGNCLIPIILGTILICAIKKKVPVYDSFIKGAKEGLELSISVFPYLIGMLFATNILLNSNLLENIFGFIKPIFDLLRIPIEIMPMAVIRPISGNASFAIMIDLIKTYGVDSFVGLVAASLQGSTDTTIYVLCLYFGSIGIKKIRYSIWAGLLTDLIAIFTSVVVVKLVFG